VFIEIDIAIEIGAIGEGFDNEPDFDLERAQSCYSGEFDASAQISPPHPPARSSRTDIKLRLRFVCSPAHPAFWRISASTLGRQDRHRLDAFGPLPIDD
jgi:hypothetical protein